MKTLVGHVSAETAYVQPDYPYGRTLRCKRRVWVETKRGHGQRVVFQTTDPKRAFEYWNAPKAGTYKALAAIALDDDPASSTFGHVIVGGFSGHRGKQELEAFLAAYGAAVDPTVAQAYLDAYAKRDERVLTKLKDAAVAAVADMPEIPAFVEAT